MKFFNPGDKINSISYPLGQRERYSETERERDKEWGRKGERERERKNPHTHWHIYGFQQSDKQHHHGNDMMASYFFFTRIILSRIFTLPPPTNHEDVLFCQDYWHHKAYFYTDNLLDPAARTDLLYSHPPWRYHIVPWILKCSGHKTPSLKYEGPCHEIHDIYQIITCIISYNKIMHTLFVQS